MTGLRLIAAALAWATPIAAIAAAPILMHRDPAAPAAKSGLPK